MLRRNTNALVSVSWRDLGRMLKSQTGSCKSSLRSTTPTAVTPISFRELSTSSPIETADETPLPKTQGQRRAPRNASNEKVAYVYDTYSQERRPVKPRNYTNPPIRNVQTSLVNGINNAIGPNPSSPTAKPLLWYICGPTVYDYGHIGHARTYVCLDIIARSLREHFGQELVIAMGITDIDDKIINRSAENNVDPIALARYFENTFMEDLRMLNVQPVDTVLRVTEHIQPIIVMVAGILKNGFAYITNDGIYFDIEKFEKNGYHYGKLKYEGRQGKHIEQYMAQQASQASNDPLFGLNYRHAPASIDIDTTHQNRGVYNPNMQPPTDTPLIHTYAEKKSPDDFCLWKFAKRGEISWRSPWGDGRPGWHIECSAMTGFTLGPQLDMHSGGIDLKFPHHCNEIAQAEAYYGWGRPESFRDEENLEWCNLWLHTGHVHIEGQKMSKSLKNFLTIRDMLALNYDADEFRMFCLLHHYRATVEWKAVRMEHAASCIRSFRSFFDTTGWTKAHCEAEQGVLQANLGKALSNQRSTSEQIQTTLQIPSLVWTWREVDLYQSFDRIRVEFSSALADDFKTHLCMDMLLELISDARKYCLLHNTVDPVVGTVKVNRYLIETIERYVQDQLTMFGLTFHLPKNEPVYQTNRVQERIDNHEVLPTNRKKAEQEKKKRENAETYEAKIAQPSQVAQSYAEFRAVMRKSLVEHLQVESAALKNPESNPEVVEYVQQTYIPLMKKLLGYCDDVRNIAMPELGFVLKDLTKISGEQAKQKQQERLERRQIKLKAAVERAEQEAKKRAVETAAKKGQEKDRTSLEHLTSPKFNTVFLDDKAQLKEFDIEESDEEPIWDDSDIRTTFYLRQKTAQDYLTETREALRFSGKNVESEIDRMKVRQQKEAHAQAQREKALREKQKKEQEELAKQQSVQKPHRPVK